jgi:hypothetical protein
MRSARRTLDAGFAIAGKILRRGFEEAVRAVEDVRERRRGEPPAAARAPAPPPPPAAARAEPPISAPPREEHVDTEVAIVGSFGPDEPPGAEVEVAEPWPGYDEMTAREIAQRVRGEDEAVAAAVRLYEAAHKDRATVLAATERTLAR